MHIFHPQYHGEVRLSGTQLSPDCGCAARPDEIGCLHQLASFIQVVQSNRCDRWSMSAVAILPRFGRDVSVVTRKRHDEGRNEAEPLTNGIWLRLEPVIGWERQAPDVLGHQGRDPAKMRLLRIDVNDIGEGALISEKDMNLDSHFHT